MCQSCQTDTNLLIPVLKRVNRDDLIEEKISNEYWCVSCINNADFTSDGDINLGIPRTK
jgi:hypothetical protein